MLIVLLRFIHIVCGVFWAGTIFFFVSFLEPAVRATGPEGAKVMVQLFARRYLTMLPAIAALAILSGFWLMWITSGGFNSTWMKSPLGHGILVGATAALVAFAVGIAVMRPAAMRLWAIAREMPQADEGRRAALMAEAGPLRDKSRTAARVVAVFLLIAVAAMGTARYW